MNIKGWSLTVVCALFSFLVVELMLQPKNDSESPAPTVEKTAVNAVENLNDVDKLKIMSGLTALEGSGITVEMNDSTKTAKSGENPNLYVIHDDDVLRVINELRAAGAEAISINGQRLIDTSEIRCAGPTLSVNNVRSAAPFIISAIGDKIALKNSIKMRGGVEQTLGVWGINIEVRVADNIYIPSFSGERRYLHAQPVDEKTVFGAK